VDVTPIQLPVPLRFLADEYGFVVSVIERPPHWAALDARAVADAFAVSAGLRAIGPAWFEMTRQEARAALAAALRKHLGAWPVGADQLGAESVAAFIALFGEGDTHFFSNGPVALAGDHARGSHWMPLTRHAFDTGVLGIDASRVGAIWVMDDD
jgi:hypothetical protein